MLMAACDLAAGPQDLELAWQLPADSSRRTGTTERIRMSCLNASVNEKLRNTVEDQREWLVPSVGKTKQKNPKPESKVNAFHSGLAIEGKTATGQNLAFSLIFRGHMTVEICVFHMWMTEVSYVSVSPRQGWKKRSDREQLLTIHYIKGSTDGCFCF